MQLKILFTARFLLPLFICALLFSFSLSIFAKPRPTLPPLPEIAPMLQHISFDDPFWASDGKAESFTTSYGELWESWSGYSLIRDGKLVSPFTLRLLGDSGKTNIAPLQGAIRFWFQPNWTTGSGPGRNARLLEMNVLTSPQMYVNWSLYFNEDGSQIFLSGYTGKGVANLLAAEIKWESGAWHSLCLNYSGKQTELFIDGGLVARGGSVLPVPPSASGLVIGSTIEGTDTASGQFDEISTFGRPLSESEFSFYYSALNQTAALGPISVEEEDAQKAAAAKYRKDHPSMLSDSESVGAYRVSGIVTNCPTNGPVYITNISCTLTTNEGSTVTFDMVGGTNGILYEIFMAMNLVGDNITNGNWTLLERGYTCNSYIFTNQPDAYAFYVLGDSTIDPDGDNLSTAYELLVSKTDPGEADTDNDGIPDGWEVAHGLNPLVDDASDDPDGDWITNLQEYQNGTNPNDTMVVAWGDNAYGQCNVPFGLGNAIALAGGEDFSAALRSDGTVLAWGKNNYGQTNVPSAITNATGLSACWNQVGVLKSNGTIVAWGLAYDLPNGLTNQVAFALGAAHGLSYGSDGLLHVWGDNSYNQTNVPSGFSNVTVVCAGLLHSAVILSNKTVGAWGLEGGDTGWHITTPPTGATNVIGLAAGYYHTLALKEDRMVIAWGAGQATNLNYFGDHGQSTVPTGLSNVIALAAGGYHSIALRSDGIVVSWGDLATPSFVGSNIVAIGSGNRHGLAIRNGRLTPLITQQPSDQFAPASSNATFTAKGIGLAGVHYQWQFNGANISGATNATFTLTNVQATNEGSYRVVISTGAGSVTSSTATFTLVYPPQVISTTPPPSAFWLSSSSEITVNATAVATNIFPIRYEWKRNGVVNTNYHGPTFPLIAYADASLLDGEYSVLVTNIAGSTNVGTWRVQAFYSGMVAAWNASTYDLIDRPPTLKTTLSIAAGPNHSLAVSEDGTVSAWGTNGFGETNVPSGLTNAISVAAGNNHGLALRSDGTVAAWGRNDYGQTNVPSGLSNFTAIAAGGNQSLALRIGGTVTNWGNTFGTIPSDLTNALAVAAGTNFCLALRSNQMIAAWGNNDFGQTNIPSAASNVVSVAAGTFHALALREDGHVISWGDMTNVPVSISNAMAVAAGSDFSMALINDGSVITWNSAGQANAPNLTEVKVITAGGNRAMAARFSGTVQYPVDVSKDLLLIYNTNSADSTVVKDYYLAHRPMVANANVLGLGYTNTNAPTYFETITPIDFTNQMITPILSWLAANPTKRPQYVVLFMDLPSRVNDDASTNVFYPYPLGIHPSASVQMQSIVAGWKPFTTHLNMGMTNTVNRTNDCIGYITKLALIGTNDSFSNPIISASAGGYGNTNFVLDDIRNGGPIILPDLPYENFSDSGSMISSVTNSLLAAGVSFSAIFFYDGLVISNNVSSAPPHATNMTNVAGYISWGVHGGLAPSSTFDGTIKWHGNSGWWLIETIESHNGQQYGDQGKFTYWYSSNAFGGTNYSNTPIGAVSHTDEPNLSGVNDAGTYFGLWAIGKNFGICAWNSKITSNFQAVGDPLIKQ